MKNFMKQITISVISMVFAGFVCFGGYSLYKASTPQPRQATMVEKFKSVCGIKVEHPDPTLAERINTLANKAKKKIILEQPKQPEPTSWEKTKDFSKTSWDKTKSFSSNSWEKTKDFSKTSWEKAKFWEDKKK